MRRAPAFWHLDAPDWRAALLLPAASIYAVIAARRFRRPPEWRASVPVICVGDATVGGAGKSPTAIALAARLAGAGRHPVFLSRGYGARVRKPVTVDPERHTASDVGDEPMMLAQHGPVVISPDRVAGAMRAQKLGDVIVMDDGFQNPALAKDVSVLVVDAASGLGNGLPLPAGPLRLPLADQLAQTQALLVIGKGDRAEIVERAAEAFGLPVLRGAVVPDAAAALPLLGRPVVAFAGIARPAKFFDGLESVGARLAERKSFADHHPFTEAEAEALLSLARRHDAVLVTTEKDMMRLEGASAPMLARLSAEAMMLPVRLTFDEASQAKLDTLLAGVLGGNLAR